ncbi:MAG: hypothetical protein ACHBN1_02030 [Heteroscytonema crispum UTEX LB 1556]
MVSRTINNPTGEPVAWVGKPYLWARSSPEGIFPTADASAPTPTNNQQTTLTCISLKRKG